MAAPKFTQRDYAAIGHVLAHSQARANVAWDIITAEFAEMFGRDNPRFKPARFFAFVKGEQPPDDRG